MKLLVPPLKTTTIRRLGLGCLLLTQIGCFSRIETFQRQPVSPPVSTTSVSLGNPECSIVQVKMMGIPDENITVNEADTSINVLLPETFVPARFAPKYILSGVKCYIPNIDTEINPCSGSWFRPTLFRGDQNNRSHPKEYKIRTKAAGDLKIGQGNEPFYVTIGEPKSVLLSVANYFSHFRWNTPPKVELVRSGDGKIIQTGLSCDTQERSTTPSATSMVLPLFGEVDDEGTYWLQVKMANGVQAKSSQPVIIRRGERVIVNFFDQFYCCPSGAGGTSRVYGYNLTPEFKPGIDLIAGNGSRTALPVKSYGPKGREMTVELPTTLETGHYIFQATQNGLPLERIGHYALSDGKRPVFLYSFLPYTSTTAQSVQTSAGKSLIVNLYYPFQANTRCKLTSVDSPVRTYMVDVELKKEMVYSGMYPPLITIPDNIASGIYRISLMQTLADGSVVEGPPHLQTLSIGL